MKTLFTFILMLPIFSLFAQKMDCKEILVRAKKEAVKGNYAVAIAKYKTAGDCDETLKGVADIEVKKLFEEINGLKEKAEKAKKEAIIEKEKATKAETATVKALQKANKMIDAFYFYDDKFALAFNSGRFYFIDKNADPVEKLGEWDKAEQFNALGLAKVIEITEPKNEFYLDTLGNKFIVAFDTAKMNSEVKALDLSEAVFDSFPNNILVHSQLELLIFDYQTYSQSSLKSLPAQIQELPNLKYLYLIHCGLDSLPSQISALQKLEVLYLQNNRLAGMQGQILPVVYLPTQIGELQNLRVLQLDGAILNNLPDEVCRLTNLKYLNLRNNDLAALPLEMGKLTNLTVLDLSFNELTNLPESFSELKNLRLLDLSFNDWEWTNVLPTLNKMTQKIAFTTYNRQANGDTLWIKISEKQAIQILEYAKMEQIFDMKKELYKLSTLNLYGVAVLPASIGELINLKELKINPATWGGKVDLQNLPLEIAKLQNLTNLDLLGCNFESLPTQVCKLKNLTDLNLQNNRLTSLPKQIVELKNLKTLNLQNNKLQTLPKEILEMKNLQRIMIQSNPIFYLPPIFETFLQEKSDLSKDELMHLFHVDTITVLNLGYRNLSVLFPQIAEYKNLVSLDLSDNQMSTLPDEISSLKNLEKLNLGSEIWRGAKNKFTEFPVQIFALTKLKFLDLSWNQMNTLPARIGELTNLEILNLDGNNFTMLPEEIKALKKLKLLKFRNNTLGEEEKERIKKLLPDCEVSFDY